jgi:hypothetical protein
VLAFALAGDAIACTCLPVDLKRDLPRADGAIVGSVLERVQGGDVVYYTLRVEQVYKGDISDRVTIGTPVNGAACGLDAQIGDRLGLLLEQGVTGDTWGSDLCSKVEPAAFLELTDVEDNTFPSVNWGGYLVGFLVLGIAAVLLLRRRRRYSGLH